MYRFNDILSRLNEIFVVLIFVLNSCFIFFLINIGKEMSLPGFRTKQNKIGCFRS